MSERHIIQTQIRKKENEIQSLEDRLKNAKVYIKALQDVLKALDKDAPSSVNDGEVSLRKGSLVARARDVILERGVPVHIDDLLEALGREVTRETKASLTGSIAAYVRREEIFTRPAPSTFGLVELAHHEIQDDSADDGPPQGFGSYTSPPLGEHPPPEDDDTPF